MNEIATLFLCVGFMGCPSLADEIQIGEAAISLYPAPPRPGCCVVLTCPHHACQHAIKKYGGFGLLMRLVLEFRRAL